MQVELYLKHGRNNPSEDLEEWGFDGPRLQNVIGTHQTYGTAIKVFFATEADARAAQGLTGWEVWDANSLTMKWKDDLVEAGGKFYGDWGLWMEGRGGR